MRIAVLTTESTHHTYFLRELQEKLGAVTVFLETQEQRFGFDTHHPFEELRDNYESRRWFGGESAVVSDFAPVKRFMSLNEEAAVLALQQEAADFAVVFGTSRLKQAVIEACPPSLLNLHGGDPENYRGLDSHLWAIYHRDFGGLMSTVHRVDAELDTGEIVSQAKVPIEDEMPLYALRAATAEICVQLTFAAADVFRRSGQVMSRPQRKVGRYYGAMPAELKSICQQNFAGFIRRVTADEAR